MPQIMPRDDASGSAENLQPKKPMQLAFALPLSPDTKIHLHITDQAHYSMILVTSATTGAPPVTTECSSLVYALPHREPRQTPLSTALYAKPNSVDFSTRLAKILAKRLRKPVYVGGQVTVWVQEDEAAAMHGCVDVVMRAIGQQASGSSASG